MSIPEKIYELIERFDNHIDEYKDKNYKEAVLCTDFLNPMFESLGWDVRNKSDRAERFRDVVQQFSQHSDVGNTRQPDYLFRIGGTPVFFLEAKKPAVNILSDRKPAYQLRRYGWNRQDIDISLLSDFEHLVAYDVRVKPKEADSPHTSMLVRYGYKDYIKKWDEIEGYFGRENVSKGSLDRMAKDFGRFVKGKREPVNESLLKMIEVWREKLAKNIALRNSDLDIFLLNTVVQKTIDRILFLRIAEDRGIEPPVGIGERRKYKLEKTIQGKNVYSKLFDLFKHADTKYNSGLFHFSHEAGRPDFDNYSKNIQIDDDVLEEIIQNLYRPNYPYDFKVLPVDILGHVYEKFLGRVITLDDSHKATIEEKPEVKKAGGVYYTPKYIVDYIVSNTVGKLLEGKTPKQVSKIKVLDPACGSGSFLLGAYQCLIDWHLDFYNSDEPEKHAKKKNPPIYEIKGGWRLTTEKKKEILLNNIYGVDIDTQAVEVAKLNLLLKVLEEENNPDLGMQRALPDLGENIKCGNSLIENDFYDDKQEVRLDKELRRKINPFDWDKEFPDIIKWKDKESRELKKGYGFDAVIGNPPYIRIQTIREWNPLSVDYYKENYRSAGKGNYDIYVVFAERGLELVGIDGVVGYILPHKFINSEFGKNIRELMFNGTNLYEFVSFGSNQVFDGATTYTALMFLDKRKKEKFRYIEVSKVGADLRLELKVEDHSSDTQKSAEVDQPKSSEPWYFSATGKDKVLEKLNKQKLRINDVTSKIFQGIATSADKIYVLEIKKELKQEYVCHSKSLGREVIIEKGLVKPFLMGKDVHRYEPPKAKNVVIFPYHIDREKPELMDKEYIQEHFPNGWKYIQENKQGLMDRERGRMHVEDYYAYIYPKNLMEFDKKQIITPEISMGCNFSFDDKSELYHTTKVYSIVKNKDCKFSKFFILGVLNSSLLWFFIETTGYTLRGGYKTFKTNYLNPFPVPDLDLKNPKDKAKHDKTVRLVETMLELNKQLAETQLSHEKKLLKRQIEITDKEIDELVYELYDLTPEEIQIVEESVR